MKNVQTAKQFDYIKIINPYGSPLKIDAIYKVLEVYSVGDLKLECTTISDGIWYTNACNYEILEVPVAGDRIKPKVGMHKDKVLLIEKVTVKIDDIDRKDLRFEAYHQLGISYFRHFDFDKVSVDPGEIEINPVKEQNPIAKASDYIRILDPLGANLEKGNIYKVSSVKHNSSFYLENATELITDYWLCSNPNNYEIIPIPAVGDKVKINAGKYDGYTLLAHSVEVSIETDKKKLMLRIHHVYGSSFISSDDWEKKEAAKTVVMSDTFKNPFNLKSHVILSEVSPKADIYQYQEPIVINKKKKSNKITIIK